MLASMLYPSIDSRPDYRIDTEDQAQNWIVDLIEDVDFVRTECDLVFPDDRNRTINHQRKMHHRLLIKHGGVLGAIMALHRCGKLDDIAYNELRQRALRALVPRVVGESQRP